jgi:maltose alpha-D-glucosyltransferase / alpha-amylase
MPERWYKEAVIYCLDVETFQDSNADGVGDLQGLIVRLDYLARLGVTCLWLNPIHPSPGRDDGYDVQEYYDVHPRIGSLGDFAELVHEAGNRGLRILIDLVINHTSDQHPWFQAARSDPKSPYRDWYIWTEEEPLDRRQGMVFPGYQADTWSYDKAAKAWYFHRFYDFEPSLNHGNREVQVEMRKVMGFWLQLGVAGFRMDAAPFVIEQPSAKTPDSQKSFDLLTNLSQFLNWRRGDAIILAEANVGNDELSEYFGDVGGSGNRLHMLFDFRMNAKLMLALARGDADPIVQTLMNTPRIPDTGQWASFLRNHDEVDLSRLTPNEREDVFKAFGPRPDMQLYGRGIRRRLAPMLGGDRRRLELAYSLQFTLPGTPVLRYGEEIGMGENLALKERDAIRTPMQWFEGANGGFSAAAADQLFRPLVDGGKYSYRRVNVTSQRLDPHSLLGWFERMIRTLRECPEIGTGKCSVVGAEVPGHVLVHRFDSPEGAILLLHNLAPEAVTIDIGSLPDTSPDVHEMFADAEYPRPTPRLKALRLGPYGYRWIRLRHNAQNFSARATPR